MNLPNVNTVQNAEQRQIMLCFAYLAYCGEHITTPDPEHTILGYINNAMSQIPPLSSPNAMWKVVWGPVTYTVPGALYQENMMFVAQNQTHTDQFVIAIRGTNSIADIDWLMEDFDILDMMNWPPGTAPSQEGPRISEATSIGLHLLLLMKDKFAADPQPTLLEFLKSQTTAPIHLCITGHSLGGCLAGTMALYLKENPGLWDNSNKSDVSCITFAAPTAGNSEFANHSDAKFKGDSAWPNWDQSLGTSCDAVRCNLDVAPMAWIASNLYNASNSSSPLFNIYQPNLDPVDSLDMEGFTLWVGLLAYLFPAIESQMIKYDYQQIESGAEPINGQFNDTYQPTGKVAFTQFLTLFANEAAYQHTKSYPIILGVPELNNANIIKPK